MPVYVFLYLTLFIQINTLWKDSYEHVWGAEQAVCADETTSVYYF